MQNPMPSSLPIGRASIACTDGRTWCMIRGCIPSSSPRARQPRSEWLAHALENGPARVIVTAIPQNRIEGIPRSLKELGFSLRMRLGPWLVWSRRPREAGAGALLRAPDDHCERPVLMATLSVKQPTCYTRGSRRTNSLKVVFERL